MLWAFSIGILCLLAFLFYLMVAVGWLSGWTRLARTYRAESRPEGEAIRFQCARFGWVDYSNCVTFVPTESGVYVAMMPPFAAGHRPLFLPWGAMTHVASKNKWHGRTTTVTIEDRPPLTVVFPTRVFERAASDMAQSSTDGDPPERSV